MHVTAIAQEAQVIQERIRETWDFLRRSKTRVAELPAEPRPRSSMVVSPCDDPGDYIDCDISYVTILTL